MQAQRFHDGFAAQLGFEAEQIFEGAVGEVNPAVAIEQQQAFEHGVEQDLLLRLGVNRRLLLPPLQILHLRLHLPLLAAEFLPPPEMDPTAAASADDGQDRPHGEGKCKWKTSNIEHPTSNIQ